MIVFVFTTQEAEFLIFLNLLGHLHTKLLQSSVSYYNIYIVRKKIIYILKKTKHVSDVICVYFRGFHLVLQRK